MKSIGVLIGTNEVRGGRPLTSKVRRKSRSASDGSAALAADATAQSTRNIEGPIPFGEIMILPPSLYGCGEVAPVRGITALCAIASVERSPVARKLAQDTPGHG